MKNKVFKYYIAAIFFCSTMTVLFAQPGDGSSGGDLETPDPPAPIGDYIWVLAAVGLLFVYTKFRAMYNAKIQG